MKSSSLNFILFSVLFFANCNRTQKTHVNACILEQGKIPNKVIDHYLTAISLPVSENGAKNLEFRKWAPFNDMDSFPLSLARIYKEDSSLKGEFYFFSDNDTGLITNKSELSHLKVFKYGPTRLTEKVKDSAIRGNWFENICYLNIESLALNKQNKLFIGNVYHILFEMSDTSSYKAIFISDPESYTGIDITLDKLANF